MANIVVTSTTNAIKVDFGVYYSNGSLQFQKATYKKTDIESIKLDTWVEINLSKELSWTVDFNGESALQIDSVDNVAPTSNEHLYNLLSALIE